jgi:ATPase family associated with various cellular activities (AAA)
VTNVEPSVGADSVERLLERLRAEFLRMPGVDASSDEGLRGLYVSQAEVEGVLDSGAPLAGTTLRQDRLEGLSSEFGLAPLDRDLLVACLGPDLDPALGRVYAFLQDDLSRTRPTVGLLMRLLGAKVRSHLGSTSPLLRGELLRLPEGADAPILSQAPWADERIVGHVMGNDAPDGRLLAYLTCHSAPRPRFLPPSAVELVAEIAARLRGELVALQGRQSIGKRQAARLIARDLGRPLLEIDVPTLLRCPACSPPQAVRLVMREARLLDAVVYWSEAAALWDESTPLAGAALAVLEAQTRSWGGVALLGGRIAWEPPPILAERPLIRLVLPAPNRQEREQAWFGALAAFDAGLDGLASEVPTLASTFRLTVEQISDAVMIAQRGAAVDGRQRLESADLRASARAVSGRGLTKLGREVAIKATWSELVVPDDCVQQLRELCSTVRTRSHVLDEWGFGRRLSGGTGVTALFAGISGTGKTMGAEVIANELGIPLFKIELAGVVSKWIGETEKNLDRVFEAAADSNAILFFDEADALFGKRSEVKDSHDRYANLEISYLLQKMESYEGAAILATNMRQQIDDAFLRRLSFTVIFPPPEMEDRGRIWAAVWPPELPRGEDVDFELLARLKLTGGNIKNIVVAAAHAAASDDECVRHSHLVHAIRREYQKVGKQIETGEIEAKLGAR